MMNKFKKSKLLVLLIILVLGTSTLLATTRSSNLVSYISNSVSFFDDLLSKPFVWLTAVKRDFDDLTQTYQENVDLKDRLYQLQKDTNKITVLEEENKQLRKLIEMQSAFEDHRTIAGQVTVRVPSFWNDELIVNVGRVNGVSTKMLAVGNGGLIGSVSEVRKNSTRLRLLTNTKSKGDISVRIKTKLNTVYGIVVGYDKEKTAFVVSQINNVDDIKEGDNVTTSGLGDYRVSDIQVGTVSSINENKDDLSKEILVAPAADLSDIRVLTLVGD